MNDEFDDVSEWDAAYVLGALNAEDRRTFERHLAASPEGTSGISELAGLPGILGMLTTDEALALANGPDDQHLRSKSHAVDLMPRLARTARLRKRRGRIAVFGALTTAFVFLITGVGFIATGSNLANHYSAFGNAAAPDVTGPIVNMMPLHGSDMTAALRLSPKSWGTRIDLSCTYPSGHSQAGAYELVITDAAGTERVVAEWTGSQASASGLAASTDLQLDSIRSVEIRPVDSGVALLSTSVDS